MGIVDTMNMFFLNNVNFTLTFNLIVQIVLMTMMYKLHPDFVARQKEDLGSLRVPIIVLNEAVMTMIGGWLPTVVGWYSILALTVIGFLIGEWPVQKPRRR